MIGQFKLTRMTAPGYRIGNRPHTANFKVVPNVRLFTSYSIDSSLQDEITSQDGVRKWTLCKFDGRISSGNCRQ